MKTLFPVIGALSTMKVKKSGMGLLNQGTSTQDKYLSSTWGSVELVWAVTGGGVFYNSDQLRTLSEERRDKGKRPGRRVQIQTQGFSEKSQRNGQAPIHTRQKNRCLAERTWYYIFKHSTIYYGI